MKNGMWSMTCETWIAHRNICEACENSDNSTCSEWRVRVEEGKLTVNYDVGKMEYNGHFNIVFHCGNFYIKLN